MPPKPRKRPATMTDVARHAGVSQTTVSFVVNDVEGVSIPEETRERIWATVSELGYRPNVLAQSLRTQRSRLFGLITDEIAITPHAGKIVEGAQDVAWDHEKILVLINTKNNPKMEKTAIEMLLERQVEGIIYATMYHHSVSPPEELWEVPTVLLDCYTEDHSLPSVVPDEVTGGESATKFLIEKGHRRIGFINNVDPIPATSGRLKGYRVALSAHGLSIDERLIYSETSDPGGGYRGALYLMQLPQPPTAIFCFNDRMAMGTYDALRKLGLAIPKDIAIMGFDNQELIAAHLYPPLTTMELPHYQMGAWAVNQLLNMIDNPEKVVPTQHKIECQLIERDSV